MLLTEEFHNAEQGFLIYGSAMPKKTYAAARDQKTLCTRCR
jgi:hypothetical protein